jgi:hypothetical protein
MGSRLVETHVVGTNADGTPFDGYMLEVRWGPARKGATWTKWGTCFLCEHEFPLSELEEHDGKLVCHRNGCYKDYLELDKHRGGK